MGKNSFLIIMLLLSLIANGLFIYSKLIRSEFAEREQSMINQFAEKESFERSAKDL
jgi:cbb3-type cytochrome oxidase subunit 3